MALKALVFRDGSRSVSVEFHAGGDVGHGVGKSGVGDVAAGFAAGDAGVGLDVVKAWCDGFFTVDSTELQVFGKRVDGSGEVCRDQVGVSHVGGVGVFDRANCGGIGRDEQVGIFTVGDVDRRGGVDCGGVRAPQVSCDKSLKSEVGSRTVRNRLRRSARKNRKLEKQAAGIDSRVRENGGRKVFDGGFVPEWRKGASPVVGTGVCTEQSERGRGFFSGAADSVRARLRDTRAERLSAENELKTFEAKRKLELGKSQDLVQLKRSQEVRLMRQTEVDKVRVEKAFSDLSRSGSAFDSRSKVETVVSSEGSAVFSGSGSGGSISPNSSVSLVQIHEMQKENLAMKEKFLQVKKYDPFLYEKLNLSGEGDVLSVGYSVDEQGQPLGDLPDSHFGGKVGKDGRFHFVTNEFDLSVYGDDGF